jgi:hypothetical protein
VKASINQALFVANPNPKNDFAAITFAAGYEQLNFKIQIFNPIGLCFMSLSLLKV